MKTLIQFIKFGIVGFINTIISYGIYVLVVHALGNKAYILGSILGFVISVFSAFLLSSRFVFKEEEGKEKRVWWKVLIKTYMSYSFTGLVLNNIMLFLWLDVIQLYRYMGFVTMVLGRLGISMGREDAAVYLAPFLNMVVTIPLNFIINKFWAYRQKKGQVNL